MRLIRGEYVKTLGFGERYPESVLNAFPYLRKAPWNSKALANEYAPRPRGTVGEIIFPVPVYVDKVWTRASDKALAVGCKVNIANHPLQGQTFTIWHLGKVLVNGGEWRPEGVVVGFVGGQYGFTGAGTGAHIAITLKVGGKYIDPQPLWDWQPPPVVPQPSPTITPISPPDAVLPSEPTLPTPPTDTAHETGATTEDKNLLESQIGWFSDFLVWIWGLLYNWVRKIFRKDA